MIDDDAEEQWADSINDFATDLSTSAGHSLTDIGSTRSEFNFSHGRTKSTATTEPCGGFAPVGPSHGKLVTRYIIPSPLVPHQEILEDGFICPYCFHLLLNFQSDSEWRYVNVPLHNNL